MSFAEAVQSALSRLCLDGALDSEEYDFFPSYSLSRLTSFKTGGNSAVLFPKTKRAVCALVPMLSQQKIPFFVLGYGSNVIAKDEGYDGVILCLSQMNDVIRDGNVLEAECGVSVTHLASVAQKESLSGMEFFYGIPGSVGGAVFMNAGAYGGECKDVLESVSFLSADGTLKTLPVSSLAMGYRTSLFEKNGGIILSARFRLHQGDAKSIRALMEDLMQRRVSKQPLDYPSAGSTFKRCEGRFTAQMIDEAGLKGARIGGAMVSEKHAGFIINYDHATSADIFALIDHVKRVILEKEKVSIACEVRVIE